MKKLGLPQFVIKDFNKGILCKSEYGIFSHLTDEEKTIVKNFEEEWRGKIYFLTKTHTDFGTMLECFYVCKDFQEWYMDHLDFENGCSMCYVRNLTYPENSEIGYIAFEKFANSIVRTR